MSSFSSYFSPNITEVIKQRDLRRAEHLPRKREISIQTVVGNPGRKNPTGRTRHIWKDNNKM
jgi:hypothetical protein